MTRYLRDEILTKETCVMIITKYKENILNGYSEYNMYERDIIADELVKLATVFLHYKNESQ